MSNSLTTSSFDANIVESVIHRLGLLFVDIAEIAIFVLDMLRSV